MSTDQANDEGNAAGNAGDILKTRRWVRDVRNQYYEDLSKYGSCSADTKQLLERAVLRYWDTLHEYRDEVEEEWAEKELDRVPQLANSQVNVPVSSAGYGTTTEMQKQPAISQVDARKLVAFTHRFDQIAYKLGFGAKAREQTSRSEIGEDLLEEYETWRQQNT